MFLIMGLKVRFKHTGTIVFFCPRCGGDRQGHQGVLRRWFTIFFVPVIPLGVVGEFVQCDTCQTRFPPDVLRHPTTADLSTVLANAVRVISVLIVRAGDTTDPAMRAAAVRDIQGMVPDYTDETLATDLPAVDPSTAEQYVQPLADGLEVAGKERFVADLTRLALTAGTITPDQRSLLDAVGRGLMLTPAHITGIVTSVVSASTPADTTPTTPTTPTAPTDPPT